MAGRRISGVAAIALIAASLLSACGGSGSPPSAPTTTAARFGPPPVGASLPLRTGATMLVVTAKRVIFPLRGSGALLAHGDRAAGVEVVVRNTGHGVYDSSSESDVGLRTSSGDQAETAFASNGPCATTEVDFLKEVQPGESRSGCVAFDLPRGSRPATVRFAPQGRQSAAAVWAVRR